MTKHNQECDSDIENENDNDNDHDNIIENNIININLKDNLIYHLERKIKKLEYNIFHQKLLIDDLTENVKDNYRKKTYNELRKKCKIKKKTT